jgi:hypothetical protein
VESIARRVFSVNGRQRLMRYCAVAPLLRTKSKKEVVFPKAIVK